MLLKHFLVLFASLCLVMCSTASNACSQAPYTRSPAQTIERADVVLVGVIQETDFKFNGTQTYGTFIAEVRPVKVYKGWFSKSIKVNGKSDDCNNNHWPFELGKIGLIVANYDGRGGLFLPYFYGNLNQMQVLNYLENGVGKYKSSECLANELNLANEPDRFGKVQPLHDLSFCFKIDENEENPFRFIPPQPEAEAASTEE